MTNCFSLSSKFQSKFRPWYIIESLGLVEVETTKDVQAPGALTSKPLSEEESWFSFRHNLGSTGPVVFAVPQCIPLVSVKMKMYIYREIENIYLYTHIKLCSS